MYEEKGENSTVVPYIGTWIETPFALGDMSDIGVVPYIGTWIETIRGKGKEGEPESYLI